MKLIILNGCPAVGKSTVSQKLHDDIPMSLLVNIDDWRRLMSGWRENREQSRKFAYAYSLAAIDSYLQTGNSVIVDKALLDDDSVLDALHSVGEKYGAEVYEIMLTADKETTAKRAADRGFNAYGGLLTPERVLELWDQAQLCITRRPQATVVDTTHLTVEQVYEKVKNIVLN
jgi:predicted kinase